MLSWYMAICGSSGVVIRPTGHADVAIVSDCYADVDWSATDLAVFDVLLLLDGIVNDDIDGLPTVRALDRLDRQHAQ
jgi:hypothetical protein